MSGAAFVRGQRASLGAGLRALPCRGLEREYPAPCFHGRARDRSLQPAYGPKIGANGSSKTAGIGVAGG
jgi:hypothetical protein